MRRLGISLSPFPGSGDGSVLVLLPALGNVVGKRIVRVGRTKQGLNGKQDGSDLKSRRPVAWACLASPRQTPSSQEDRLTLQHVKADTAQLVDIGVVDFGQEAHLRRGHGVIVRKK